MIGGSTGVQDWADSTRTSTDTTQITDRTDTENKNRGVEIITIPETFRTMTGIFEQTSYSFSARLFIRLIVRVASLTNYPLYHYYLAW